MFDLILLRATVVAASAAIFAAAAPQGLSTSQSALAGALSGILIVLVEIRLRRVPLKRLIGSAIGLLAAVEALSWHTSELIIPNLPDLTAKIIAWSFFLLRAAGVAYFYTALLLGVGALLEKREARQRGQATEGTIARAFLLTIIVLAMPFFYAAIKLSAVDPAVFESGVEGAAGLINPCKPNDAARERLTARLDRQVDNERRKALHDVDTSVDQGLERIFSDVEKGVDSYLDWYFTVFGEYQRLAAVSKQPARNRSSICSSCSSQSG